MPQLVERLDTPLTARDAFGQYRRKLIIAIGRETYVFSLSGESFKLVLSDDVKRAATVKQDGVGVYLNIPHPERLRSAEWAEGSGFSGSTVVTGLFSLKQTGVFVFGAKEMPPYSGDVKLEVLFNAYEQRYIYLDGGRARINLGSVSISAIDKLPSGPGGFWGRAFHSIKGWFVDGWSTKGSVIPTLGQSHGLMLGDGTEYVVIQTVEIGGHHLDPRVYFAYKYQTDGSPNF